MAIILTSGGVG